MALNLIWVAFFIIAFVIALFNLIVFQDTSTINEIMQATFTSSKGAFELALGLTGAMTLWLGIMNIGEKAGAVGFISKIIGPLFNRLFPELPKDHPVHGQILMNFSANMLGLSNAATPMGLKAMESMQELNPDKEKASNSQIMLLVLITGGFSLIPVTIMAYRATRGAANPADVFIPILISSFIATAGGVLFVGLKQKINFLDKVILSWFLGIVLLLGTLIYSIRGLSPEKISIVSGVLSGVILFGIIVAFISAALLKKINVFETFIEGSKKGFETAVRIIPYMVAILVGIAVFRASHAMDLLLSGIDKGLALVGIHVDFIQALPTAFMKPLSGSGSQGMMNDTMITYGADSFVGRLSCVFSGAADTTFYIIALYFGSVGIKKTRYAIGYGLLTDLIGITAAIVVSYLFFPH